MQILSIEFIFGANEGAEDLEDEDDRYSDRRIAVKVKTPRGVETVNVTSCHESYEQWGAGESVLFFTLPYAKAFTPWLHGGQLNA